MIWQEFVRDYLTFTRKERIGLITISLVMILVIFYPQLKTTFSRSKQVTYDTSWMSKVKSLQIKNSNEPGNNFPISDSGEHDNSFQYEQSKGSFGSYPKRELFYFDPNTLSFKNWQKLGIKEKTINTIQNYLSKGGRFKKPEDLQKIYGLKKEDYEILSPFITIEQDLKIVEEQNSKQSGETFTNKNFSTRYSIIEINKADTTAYISLPGIGIKLAARIVSFRTNLGGFYSIDQIAETYGLSDSTFQNIKQYLKLDNSTVKKININTAKVDELKAHPYIKYSLANPIIAYRNEHGLFEKIEDLKKIIVVNDEIYKKIFPYLTIQ